MPGNGSKKAKSRWLREEIEWGLELAGYYDVTLYDDDYWDEDWDESDEDDNAAQVLRQELTDKLRLLVPKGATHEEIVPGSHESDLGATMAQAELLATQIETADLAELGDLGPAVEQIGSAINDVKLKVEKRQQAQQELLLLKAAIMVPEGAEDGEINSFDAAKKLVTTALATAPLTDKALEVAQNGLDALKKEVLRIDEQVGIRRAEHQRIVSEAAKITETGYLKDQKARLLKARETLDAALKPPITTARNGLADDALKALAALALVVGDEVASLGGGEKIDQVCDAVGMDVEDFEEFEAVFGGRADTARIMAAFPAAELGAICTAFGGGLKGAEKLAELVKAFGAVDEMKKAMAAMGGKENLAALMSAGSASALEVKNLCDELGGGFVGALMGPGHDPAAALALQNQFGGNVKALKELTEEAGFDENPKALAALFTKGCGGDAAKFQTLCAGIDSSDERAKLKGMLTYGGLGDAPDAFGELVGVGCGSDPAQLKQLSASLDSKESREGLKLLLTDGGFAGKSGVLGKGDIDPKCLARLLIDGSGPDASGDVAARSGGFATLLKGLDKTACENLKGIMGAGGLGRAPEAMGHLVGIGCGGDPAQLKELGAAFDDPGKRAGLERLLSKGGLAGKSGAGPVAAGEVDPKCLGQLLKRGAGGTADAKTRAEGLQKLSAGLDDTACENLEKSLKAGGLGTEPEVFGELVGVGCKEGDPARLTALAGELASDPSKLKGLDDLLKKGGFGSKDTGGVATGIDNTCLANLFAPGCDGKPDELTKLLTNLSDTDLTNLKGLMKDAELGKHPKVIGSMYKHGCIAAPDGASDGAKNPTVLKDMMGEFAPPGGPAQFRDLLVNGGFIDGGKEDRLGSMMRYGFATKGGAQDGKQLKKLHTAFDTHMADLKKTMNAMETAPAWVLEGSGVDEPNQPGKGLRNVFNAPGLHQDASLMRSKFFVPLETRSTAAAGGPATVPRLTMDELLQNAASFEHESVHPPDQQVNPPPTLLRLNHVVDRHTRKFNKFLLHAGGDNTPTTLYPRDVKDAEVKTSVVGTIANIPNPARGNRPGTANPKRNPPQDQDDLQPGGGGYTMYVNPAPPPPGVIDGQGRSNKIAYKIHGTGIRIDQFFPLSGPNLLQVKKRDMQAMKDALL